MESDVGGRGKDRRAFLPENMLEMLEKKLVDAEHRADRARVVLDWQRSLIDQMCAQGRNDVGLAQEVLNMLHESLHWSEAQVKQVRADLDFLNRQPLS